jgi:hypothetical protein
VSPRTNSKTPRLDKAAEILRGTAEMLDLPVPSEAELEAQAQAQEQQRQAQAQATLDLQKAQAGAHGALGGFVEKYNLDSQVEKLSSQLSTRLDDVGSSAVTAVSKIGSSVFATLTVLVLTVMIAPVLRVRPVQPRRRRGRWPERSCRY